MIGPTVGLRFVQLGVDVPAGGGEFPSHRLYALLSRSGGGVHIRYNALVGRIASFARAAEPLHSARGSI